MKTFDEACDAVFLRKVETKEQLDAGIPGDLVERNNQYKPTILEVQENPRTVIFVRALLEMMAEGFTGATLLAIAFSHGVAVGMEMNAPDVDMEKMFDGL